MTTKSQDEAPFKVGDIAVVMAGLGGPNNVREKPATGGRRIGKIPEHAVLAILPKPEGWRGAYPHRDGTYEWWYVRGRTGTEPADGRFQVIEGWTVASKQGQSYLRRMEPSQGCLDTMGTALDTHLQIGQQAYVLPLDGLNVREAADPHAKRIGGLVQGTVVTLEGGPECDSKMVWWQVKPLNAPQPKGWASEGNILEWFLAPLTLM
jgi:hypothetical protein